VSRADKSKSVMSLSGRRGGRVQVYGERDEQFPQSTG
jgi:hypothetical protein